MKKYLNWLPVLGMLLVAIGCTDDLTGVDDITPGNLSEEIRDFIDANYSDYRIDDAHIEDYCNDNQVYEIELEDGPGPDIDLYFSLDNEFLFAAIEISVDDLPQAVLDAIAAEFPGYTIGDDDGDDDDVERLIFADGTVQFEVELESNDDDDFDVIFDVDGNIICRDSNSDDDDDDRNDDSNSDDDDDDDRNDDSSSDDDDDSDDGDDDDDNDSDDDSSSDDDDDGNNSNVPQSIFDYVSANYSGYDIESVETDDLCDDTVVYEVELEDGPGPDVDLYFNLNGDFLFEAKEISASALPDAVLTAIAAEFPGYEIEDDDTERFKLADGSLQYSVKLERDSGSDVEVVFDANGNIVCKDD